MSRTGWSVCLIVLSVLIGVGLWVFSVVNT